MDTEATTTEPTQGRRYLPWAVAAGALIFYLITLNWGITLPGLAALPRITGWDWELTYAGPLLFLATYPVRWLPADWQIPALNIMAAVCASLTLALLARSVMLLPHDRTREQRQLERSDYSFLSIRLYWVPPLFAVLVCGLQYTFWQHAIVNTGEALDLLCFAYAVRCLLEARADERDSWLAKTALVYGLSITNNFAMIGFLPLFIGALIWIKGYRLLDSGLVIQVVLWGLAGLLLYFLLPTVNMLSDRAGQPFWEMVRMNIGNQRESLGGVPNWVLLLVGLTSILPVVFIGIRWPASFGDVSAAGNALTNLMTHVIHGVFLVACLYVTFDPPFSPRHLAENRQMLPFYYLGALAIGYFAGYFLLLFGQRPHAIKAWQRPSPLRMLMNYTVTGLVLAAAVATPAGLFVQNKREIALMGNHYLQEMGDLAVSSLPKEKLVILSDDPQRLYALEAALARRSGRQNYVLVHTGSMNQPGYHRYLRNRYPQRWPDILAERPLEQRIEQKALAEFLVDVNKTSPLFYLHPSFGYFFESFYSVPHQMIFELHRYPTNEVAGPPLTSDQVATNFQYWQKLSETTLAPLKMTQDIEKALKTEADQILFVMGTMYSRTINAVGVEFQRAGALKEAGAMFKLALAFNAFNPYAFINMEYNGKLQTGERKLEPSDGARMRLGRYRSNWNAILNGNGPPDEPNSCFLLAEALARGRNYRQAALQLLRTVEYQPDNFQAHVGLATMMVRAGMPEKGLEELTRVRSQFKELKLPEEMALVQAEAWAFSKQGNLPKAIELLQKEQKDHPDQSGPFGTLAEIYLDAGQITNAMQVFQKELEVQPKNTSAQINYYALQIQNKQFPQAIQGLTKFLEENPKDGRGRLNRAIAYFLSGDMDKAEIDYRALLDAEGTPPHPVYYGLGEINFRRNKLKEALKDFESYLSTAPRDTPEYKNVEERVKDLKRKL